MALHFPIRFIWWMSRIFPRQLRISDLETVLPDDVLAFGGLSVLPAFRRAARIFPFYQKILKESKVDVSQIRTLEDFSRNVPILRKEDIFQRFDAQSLCKDGRLDDICGAIVTSGTSGVFAYNFLARTELRSQEREIDAFFDYYFSTKNDRLLIINALAMGVSFVSRHSVVNASVRPDMVVHFIRTFSSFYERTVIVCDPNFAKRILDEGKSSGIRWEDVPVSFVLGGAWASNSLVQYVFSRIGGGGNRIGNTVSLTMGITEIGLNVFSAPPELIALRDILQNDRGLLSDIFGDEASVCPEIMYYYPTRTYVEIVEADGSGKGRIVVSDLAMRTTTTFFRYDAGDRGRFLDRDAVLRRLKSKGHSFSFRLGLPLIAIYDREDERDADRISVPQIKESLFSDVDIAPFFTGHFKMLPGHSAVDVQLEKGVEKDDEIRSSLETSLERVSGKSFPVDLVAYQDFRFDMNLDYERKWKHLR